MGAYDYLEKPVDNDELLRALGEKEIVKIGRTKTIPIDVRIIAATNQNLKEKEKKGDFREDLYWRLAVLSLHLPPLREKKEDIPLLCEHLIQKYNQELNREIKDITDKALEYILHYSWPGNIRELENVIYEAMVLSDSSSVEEKNLSLRLKGTEAEKEGVLFESDRPLNEEIQSITEKVEKKLIKKALREAGGNKTKAAQKLGISRKTLFNKMTQHNIQ